MLGPELFGFEMVVSEMLVPAQYLFMATSGWAGCCITEHSSRTKEHNGMGCNESLMNRDTFFTMQYSVYFYKDHDLYMIHFLCYHVES